MIDEKIILSEISNLKKNEKSENSDYLSGYVSALSTVEGLIAGQDKNGGWILCSGRLPEVYKPVLINYHRESDNFDKIAVAYMGSDCEWKIEFGGVRDCESVIAWQPLPELYKPKRGGEK